MPELPPPSGGHTGTAGPLRKYHPKDPAYPNHLALTLAIITLPLKILDRVANSALLDRVATASIRPTTPRGFFILPLVLSSHRRHRQRNRHRGLRHLWSPEHHHRRARLISGPNTIVALRYGHGPSGADITGC